MIKGVDTCLEHVSWGTQYANLTFGSASPNPDVRLSTHAACTMQAGSCRGLCKAEEVKVMVVGA